MNYISRNLLLEQEKTTAGFSVEIEGCLRICVQILKNNQNTRKKLEAFFFVNFLYYFPFHWVLIFIRSLYFGFKLHLL